jgi:hypothetical protein
MNQCDYMMMMMMMMLVISAGCVVKVATVTMGTAKKAVA